MSVFFTKQKALVCSYRIIVRWKRWSVRHDAKQTPFIDVITWTSGTVSWRQVEENVNSLLLAISHPMDNVQRPVEHVETGIEGR